MEQVTAEWNNRRYRATVNEYNVATIKPGTEAEGDAGLEHELSRLADDGGACCGS